MTELLPPELWAQLGISAVFLALFIYFHRNWSDERKEKDGRLNQMAKDLISVYASVAESYTELKNAIDNNTEAVKELCRMNRKEDT